MSAIWHPDLALPAVLAGLAFVCGIAIAFTDGGVFGFVALLWLSVAAAILWDFFHLARAS